MPNYTTIQGDTWDMISYKVYCSEMHINTLIEANPEHREVVFFDGGIELIIPTIEEPQLTTLPTWKRE